MFLEVADGLVSSLMTIFEARLNQARDIEPGLAVFQK